MPDFFSEMHRPELSDQVVRYIQNLKIQIIAFTDKYNIRSRTDLLAASEREDIPTEDLKHFLELHSRLVYASQENKIPLGETPEQGQPFVYDKQKAKEYGFSELTIKAHEKAQVLVSAIYNHDSAFVRSQGRIPTVDLNAVTRYWKQYCTDLADIPEQSGWLFQAIAEHRLSHTIDRDDEENIDHPTKPYIPDFGKPEFLLVMNYHEFDWDHSVEMITSITPQTKKIMQKLFRKKNVTHISRRDINDMLWIDHESRIQAPNAVAVIKELIGSSEDPTHFELRLIRFEEYVRASQTYGFGTKNLWTLFDGYYVRGDGHRYGLIGGFRPLGGVARVNYGRRDAQSLDQSVRLVLSRKI